MTAKEEHLVEELRQEIERRFPEARVVRVTPVPDGGILLLVETPVEEDEL